jgi:molybdopterin/thiamine biosynthesis adenylyltransferase
MSASDHSAIRDYLMRESKGVGNPGKKMILNPKTGKFEVVSSFENSGSESAEITAEDMKSFGGDATGLRHIVLDAAVADRIRAGEIRSARLVYRDGGDVATVLDEPGDDVVVAPDHPASSAKVVCRLTDDGALWSVGDRQLAATVRPAAADVFDRIEGLFETDKLAGRSVAVLGLGSGGSFIVRELARSGVGRFLLLDDDRMEVGNVSRHECGLSDLGRLKTNAMRDHVLDRNPAATVTTSTLRIESDTVDDLTELLDRFRPDLVVCATDNRASRLLVNRVCVLSGRTALYAGVFRRAYGGQVLRVIPGLTPCYQCFLSALPAMASDFEVSSSAAADRTAYSDRPVAIEPGLSSDIVPISLQVAKLALMELLQGIPTTLSSLYEDLVAPLYLWLNRREDGTDYASLAPMATGVDELSILRWYGIRLDRNQNCAACGTHQLADLPAAAVPDVSAFRTPAENA